MKIVTYFLDSNYFIQCKTHSEINWSEIQLGTELTKLIIPRPVQEEIEKFKSEGNTRRGSKSRKASTFFKEMINNNFIYEYNYLNNLITFNFSPRYKKDEYTSIDDILDLDKADDRIIADLILYNSKNEDKAILLTHDTNLMLSAQHFSLEYCNIPESWFIKEETDEKDKKILVLEKKIKEYEEQLPKMNVHIENISSNIDSANQVTINKYSDLEEDQINRIMDIFKERNPLKTDFSEEKKERRNNYGITEIVSQFYGHKKYFPPTDADISKYQDETYPKWIDNLKVWLSNATKSLEYSSRIFSVNTFIQNTGTVPADDLIIDFKAYNNMKFISPDTEFEHNTLSSVPKAPIPPRGEWKYVEPSFLSALHDFPNIANLVSPFDINHMRIPFIRKQERDRLKFYWKIEKPIIETDFWSFECSEFRHGMEPKVFNLRIFVPLEEDISSGSIEIKISSRNIPKTIREYYKYNFLYHTIDTYKAIVDLLNQ